MSTDRDDQSPGGSPRVNRAEMSAFLAERIASDGSVVLTRLPAPSGPATCRVFTDVEPALAWAERWTPTCNIYVVNNPPEVGWEPPNASDARDGGDNPKARDISLRCRLQLDGDPRDGVALVDAKAEAASLSDEFFTWARARAEAIPPQSRPPGILAPTLQVDSGRGLHLHLDLVNRVESTDFVAEVNKRIIEWFRDRAKLTKWDGVHNPARLMRCPGSWNHRTGTHVRVVHHDPEARASFGLWMEIMGAGTRAAATTTSPAVKGCTAPVEPVATVDELGPDVPARTKVIIVQGKHPDEPPKGGDDSRSGWMFDAACWLVRSRVPDGKILGALLNPAFGVSACILDKPKPEEYARRQVERAKAEVAKEPPDGDVVAEINRRYFAATEGGKLTFYREEDDGSIEHMTGEVFDFELAPVKATFRVVNARGEESVKVVPASKVWRESPNRRYYRRGMILQPDGEVPSGYYNLWRGFGVQSVPGDWSLLRAHIKNILAGGSEEYAEYIENWTAWSLQNPATPPRVALVFRGLEGTGKGLFGNALCRIFGRHGQRLQSMQQVAGRFNAHFRHCCLLFADEATVVGDEGEGVLKGIITEPTLPIEGKGKDIVHAQNHLHVVMASNRDWVVPVGIGARRFAIFDVSAERKGDKAYFDALFAEMREGGLGAMLHDLLAKRLDGWHPEAHRPDTAAQADQVIRGLRGVERAFFDCLCSGTLPCGHVVPKEHRRKPNEAARAVGSAHVPTVHLQEAWSVRLRDFVSTQSIADLFKKLGFTYRDTRPRGWEVPPLPVARERWTEHFKWRGWDPATTWVVTAQTADAEDRDSEKPGEPESPF